MLTARAAAAVSVVLALLTACTGDDEPDPDHETVEVPEGITLTSGGSTVELGHAASVVYGDGDAEPTVITVRVDDIVRGDPKDLEGIDGAPDGAVPFFVEASIRNAGPATLPAAPVPLYAAAGRGNHLEAADLARTPDGCKQLATDVRLAPGGTEHGCLLFAVPDNAEFEGIQVRTEGLNRPVTWKP